MDSPVMGSEGSYLSILVLGRYLQDHYAGNLNGTAIASGLIDGGGRIVFQVNRMTVGVEGLIRGLTDARLPDRFTHRLVGTLTYKISNSLSVNSAFGKNF